MDKSLQTLCSALKRIFCQLKPQSNQISFVLLTGKSQQGKTVLLRQSRLNHLPVDLENNANIFYNKRGVILELGQYWLNRSENLLSYTLKQLNNCHSHVKISGLLLCVDSGELLTVEPNQLLDHCKEHLQLLQRFGLALGYRVNLGVVFNKLDTLAGFSEFYQSEHNNELQKPLGFSLTHAEDKNQFLEHFKHQFNTLLESLGQQIISKLHPARSTMKRTLIREFPLQLASLRIPIQAIIQNISPKFFRLQAVYFTSSEQGGVSLDKLNKKIQHEYALIVQDKFPQSNNYRAYFIEGAIRAFQEHTKYVHPIITVKHKAYATATLATVALLLSGLVYRHIDTSRLLDETSRELINYETLIGQKDKNSTALYHLSQAEATLSSVRISPFSNSFIGQLQTQIHNNTKLRMQENFLPDVLGALQEVILNPAETQFNRYQALKIYLMLGQPEHFSEKAVTDWFNAYWHKKNPVETSDRELLLLKKALQQPMQPIAINWQLVRDSRNYLNALPSAYLYYSLAKNSFPQQKQTIKAPGFNLAYTEIPIYFTKAGFNEIMANLPQISQALMQDSWVLAREEKFDLQSQLEEAYSTEYAAWWQNFIRHTKPQHYQSYKEAGALTELLIKNNAISSLVHFIQQETAPDTGTYAKQFNNKIAPQFTSINLLAVSAINDLNQTIAELNKFLTTLSLVTDQGQTVFELTKTRFQNSNSVDPLSALYNRAHQLPEPVALWAKQIADDSWFMFITDSKQYVNLQWQKEVYRDYETTIAHRFPLDSQAENEITLADFERFFNPNGILTQFVNNNLKPFIDTSNPQWQSKEVNGYVLPISEDLMNELIRANVITQMFFPQNNPISKIEFSLQKIELDPVVSNLQLTIGNTILTDNQSSESYTSFNWPESNAKLILKAIDGNHYELEETGPWAFFKILQKVNVLVDPSDSANLQILFEVNGNSGRYLLKTQNQINPFSPGILAGFNLYQSLA